MPYFIVRHTVEDYDRWRPFFDEHAQARQAAGAQGGRLFRSADNPNEIVIVWQWDSLDNARRFAASDELREKMHDAGVVGRPELYFLDYDETVPV